MSAGGSSGSSDTRFERRGTADTVSFREFFPEHSSRFAAGMDSTNPTDTAGSVKGHVNSSLQFDNGDIPFQSQLSQIVGANLPGTGVPGEASLGAQAGVDPFGTSYADNTFDRFKMDVDKTLAQVSGPMATRGGTAAQGFMQQEALNQANLSREDVLNSNRQTDAGIQQGASQALHSMRSRDTQEALSAIGQQQGSWGQLLGNQNNTAGVGNQMSGIFSDLVQNYVGLQAPVYGTESNNLTGRGSQSSSAVGANVSLCCFIFLEYYNGIMPASVRYWRDKFAPENSDRRNGYIWMAKWLVPAMRKSKLVRKLVEKTMINPLTAWGVKNKSREQRGLQVEKHNTAMRFWFNLWTALGKITK